MNNYYYLPDEKIVKGYESLLEKKRKQRDLIVRLKAQLHNAEQIYTHLEQSVSEIESEIQLRELKTIYEKQNQTWCDKLYEHAENYVNGNDEDISSHLETMEDEQAVFLYRRYVRKLLENNNQVDFSKIFGDV